MLVFQVLLERFYRGKEFLRGAPHLVNWLWQQKYKSARKINFKALAHFWRALRYHFQKAKHILLIFEGKSRFQKVQLFGAGNAWARAQGFLQKIFWDPGFFYSNTLHPMLPKKILLPVATPLIDKKRPFFNFKRIMHLKFVWKAEISKTPQIVDREPPIEISD